MRLTGVLVEERLFQLRLDLDRARQLLHLGLRRALDPGRGLEDARQALPPLLDGLQRPFEDALEGGELLVDVVLGLVPELAGGGAGGAPGRVRAAAGAAAHPPA